MASFLERLLNQGQNNLNRAQTEVLANYNSSYVMNVSPKGIQMAVPDNRVSSAYARSNAQQILGYVPPQMRVKGGNVIPFSGETGDATYKALVAAGIKRGSSVFDLQRALQIANQTDTRNVPMERSNNGVPVPTPRPANDALNAGTAGIANGKGGGGVSSGDGYLRDEGRTNPAAAYSRGYQQSQSGNTDFLQLETFVNRQADQMNRLLHNSLFGNF